MNYDFFFPCFLRALISFCRTKLSALLAANMSSNSSTLYFSKLFSSSNLEFCFLRPPSTGLSSAPPPAIVRVHASLCVLWTHCHLLTTHCPSWKATRWPPSFMDTLPASRLRSCTEYVDSSRDDKLPREADFLLLGFLPDLKLERLNSGIFIYRDKRRYGFVGVALTL